MDRTPILLGDKINLMGTVPTPKILERIAHIEKNAVDQSDFDELKEKVDTLIAALARQAEIRTPEVSAINDPV